MHCSLSRDQTIFSKRDRSHCDFSCLLRLVVRGLIFLLPGRVSGPISLLSGRASHHHLKRQYKMTLHMEDPNRHIKWWLKDHFSCRGQLSNPDILKHGCWVHCSLSRVCQILQQKGSISLWFQLPTLVVIWKGNVKWHLFRLFLYIQLNKICWETQEFAS